MNHRSVISASSAKGADVWNDSGEKLGNIDEVMLDAATGRVAYAVLSFGGFLGFGDKLFAVPWEALELDPDQETFILNVSKTVLESAPGFDKDNWPDMADPSFGNTVYQHYGYEPYWNRERRTF